MNLSLNAYNGNTLQSFASLLSQFEATGTTDTRFVRKYVQDHVHERAKKWRKNTAETRKQARELSKQNPIKPQKTGKFKCKKCGNYALAEPVNISKCTRTPNPKDRTSIQCQDKKCLHIQMSELFVDELLAQLSTGIK